MALGEAVLITLEVADFMPAFAVLCRLGFNLLERAHSRALYGDGRNLIQLQAGEARGLALHYFGVGNEQQWPAELTLDGLRVVLHAGEASDLPDPGDSQSPRCGSFGELSLRVDDLEFSAARWGDLGFTVQKTASQAYPWGILSDGLMTLGLYQRPVSAVAANEVFDFPGPTLTYFAPDMPARIATLKTNGVQPLVEIVDKEGTIAGAVMAIPGGGQIFLFRGKP